MIPTVYFKNLHVEKARKEVAQNINSGYLRMVGLWVTVFTLSNMSILK